MSSSALIRPEQNSSNEQAPDAAEPTAREADDLGAPPEVVQAVLQGALDQRGIGVFFYDAKWRLTFTNAAGSSMLENHHDSPIGKTITELNPSWQTGPFFAAVKEATTTQQPSSYREHAESLDRWLETTVFRAAGGVAVYVADVDTEERAQRELANTLKRLRRKVDILDASRDAVYVRELDHVISYWSRGAQTLYGWTPEEVLGRSTRELLYLNVEDFDAATAKLMDTGVWMGELTQLTKDGRAFTADCRWQLARDADDNPLHVLCNVSHESEQQRDQERRYRAQRLEGLGLLAGGIAHNLNNVLAPLLLTAQYVAANESNPALKELLRSMEPTIARGSEMIAQVLGYSRGEEGQRTRVDVRPLIGELETFCRDILPTSITVRSEIALDYPFLIGDSTQIMQVLVNLATNARDAMPDGGTFEIRAYNHDLANEHDGTTVRGIAIEACDSGTGMDAPTIARAFEPFYSTKEVGSGTGLGLSTSLAIAHGHGGELSVLSTPGSGARIQLLLPAIDEQATPLDIPEIPEPVAPPRKTVLVVDDEAPLRAIVRATLESHGYRTFGASHGREALDLIESGTERFDLVFTDMMMPEMGGRELEKYLRERHPSLPVIAVTGHFAEDGLAESLRAGSRQLLKKPFSTTELLEAVSKELPAEEL